MARKMGVDVTFNYRERSVGEEVLKLNGGGGDVGISRALFRLPVPVPAFILRTPFLPLQHCPGAPSRTL